MRGSLGSYSKFKLAVGKKEGKNSVRSENQNKNKTESDIDLKCPVDLRM